MLSVAAPTPEQSAAPPFLGMSDEQRATVAREVEAFFREGKAARAQTDLTREKYLVHLDGEGDGQYAEIINGTIAPLPNVGERLRVQWNLLRPITANMVKHHTSIPFRCIVEMAGVRRQRDKARAAAAYGNHVIRHQKLNQIFAEALWMAAPYGHCPVHFQWRDDLSADPYQPLYLEAEEAQQYQGLLRPGFTDAFCGDPWNTVYNAGATRTSVHRMCWGRTVPTGMLKTRFASVPGVEKLVGRTDLPSASRFQRAARRFMSAAGNVHGTAVVAAGNRSEALTMLLCDELAPGLDPQWPRGRLRIVALDHMADADDGQRPSGTLLLHEGPLPGGRFSAVRVYASDSFDDVLGRPFLADLDDLQIFLNQLATLRTERIRRFARTQLLAQANTLEDDTLLTVDDAILYYTGEKPGFLAPPQAEQGLLDNQIRDTMETMFRIGGWQAASRGEGKAGDAAAKVVALANADDSIFASANQFFQEAVCEGLQTAHGLAKEFMVVPTTLMVSGTDMDYIGEITRDDLLDTPPSYALTQGSASPEARLQQNLTLVTTLGADQKPLMTTEQFHEANPDPSLRPVVSEVARMRRTRPFLINRAIQQAADQAGQQIQQQASQMPPQWAAQVQQQAASAIDFQIDQQWHLEAGDDPQANLDALDELILDPDTAPLAQAVARLRRDRIAAWQAQMIAYQQMVAAGSQMQSGMMQGGAQGAPPMPGGGSPFAGSPTSREFANQSGAVDRMTAAAAQS